MPKRAGWRAVKRHRNYKVDEVARTLCVAKGTVRRWIKDGLPALTDQRPALILGEDLVDFLKQAKTSKQKCAIDECYCFRCRAPRRPAFDEVEYHPANAKGGNIRALCVICSTVMHKRTSLQGIDQLAKRVTVVTVAKVAKDCAD